MCHDDESVKMNDQDHRTRVAAERRTRMRENLLLCGFQLAAERGLGGFVIDDVTTRAGVSRGTFYKYFPSTEALVRDVALDLSQELILTVQQLFTGQEDPAVRAAFGVRAVLRWVRQAPALGAFITRAGWPHAEPGHVFFRLVAPNLDAGIALGRFRLLHRDIGLALIGGLSIGAMHRLAGPGLPEDFPDRVAETLLVALGIDGDEARAFARLPFALPPALPGGLIFSAVAAGG
jgi:TetR/AcrR family transcriptional regulator, ethionamide resistance regulator